MTNSHFSIHLVITMIDLFNLILIKALGKPCLAAWSVHIHDRTDLFLLGSLHGKPIVKGRRGHPAAEGPQHAASPTQNAKIAQEAERNTHQLTLQSEGDG